MTPRLHTHAHSGPIALFGGVYGNLPALQACLDDAARANAGLRIFLGDATGCCGHSDVTLDLLREHCHVWIAGNHEVQAAAGEATCGCGYGEGMDEQLSCDAHAYAMHSLREDQRQWVASWPITGIVAAPNGRMLLCHGSPDRNNEFLYESQLDDARLEAWLDTHDCDVLACTHTGLPWVRYLPGGRVAVNVGAVGKPDHDGDAAVHYALLDYSRGHARVSIRRVEYDHAAWVSQLHAEGVAEVYTAPLATGWWTVGESSLPPAERSRRPAVLPEAIARFYTQVATGQTRLGQGADASCCAPAPILDSLKLGYATHVLANLPTGVDMGLGCGSPVDAARLQPGEIVLDLGSGGGMDCLLAAKAVGETGSVLGVDATPEMVARARANVQRAGHANVDVRLGTIEKLPVVDASVDVVISNCVINLSRDKPSVFAESLRVLKPGGRFVVADTVALGETPNSVVDDAQMQACCVAGAMTAVAYREQLAKAGFAEITVDIHENSRDIVASWVPGSGAEQHVAAAIIRAAKPAHAA